MGCKIVILCTLVAFILGISFQFHYNQVQLITCFIGKFMKKRLVVCYSEILLSPLGFNGTFFTHVFYLQQYKL